MRMAHFVIISLGLMFLFYLAGVDTGSSKMMTSVFGSNNITNQNIDINPNVSISEGVVDSSSGIINTLVNKPIWFVILASLLLILILSIFKVSFLSFNWNPSVDAGYIAIGIVIWGLVSLDMFSIWTELNRITGAEGWMYLITTILIFTYLIAFAFSIFRFARSGE